MILVSLLSAREGVLGESALTPSGTFEKGNVGLLIVRLLVAVTDVSSDACE